MAITVLYFARFREQLGRDGETLSTSAPLTVATLRAQLAARGERYAEVFAGAAPVLAAVNEVMAHDSTSVTDGDTVAFFPMLTGG